MSSFTLAVIVINIVIISILLLRTGRNIELPENGLYILFPVIFIIVALIYELTTYPIPSYVLKDNMYLTIIRLIGTVLKLFLAYYLVYYCTHLVYIHGSGRNMMKEKKYKLLMNIPMVIAVIEAVLSPKFHLLFYFDSDNKYVSVSYDIVYYIIAIYYFVLAVWILLPARKIISRQTVYTSVVFIILSTAGMIIQSGLNITNFDIFIFSIACLVMLYIIMDSSEMVRTLVKKNAEITALTSQAIAALTDTIEASDDYTKGHSARVAEYSVKIAKKMNFDEAACQELYYAAMMHDIGKVGIPHEIIKKPGTLTDEEYDIVKQHPVIGSKITREITVMPIISRVTRWHHERYDGKGYPDGIAGKDIPLEARIVSVADAYDAMTSDRTYRKAKPIDEVYGEFEAGKGKQFDPEITEIMVQMMKEEAEEEIR